MVKDCNTIERVFFLNLVFCVIALLGLKVDLGGVWCGSNEAALTEFLICTERYTQQVIQ